MLTGGTEQQVRGIIETLEARADLAQQTFDAMAQLRPADTPDGEAARTKLRERCIGERTAYLEAANLLRELL